MTPLPGSSGRCLCGCMDAPDPTTGAYELCPIAEAHLEAEAERADPGARDGAIHGYFGLSYANYLVIPRTLMQSMPLAWQDRAVAVLDELNDAFAHIEWGGPYNVRVLDHSPEHIDRDDCDTCDGEGIDDPFAENPVPCEDCDGEGRVDANRWETPEEVGIVTDPVPHYSRGRTRIARADQTDPTTKDAT